MSIGSGQFASTIHSVQFYQHDEALINRLRSIVASGLQVGNSVLLVMTREHQSQLLQELRRWGIDVHAAEREGRFAIYDASETLSGFIVNGCPDPVRFAATLGPLVETHKIAARSAHHGLTVFGEMVALLWKEGNQQGAMELEELWNNLLSNRTFHLHCAYPRSSFTAKGAKAEFESICRHHSHVIGAVA
jgi:hypothetical protein